jgi:hypothetical protein
VGKQRDSEEDEDETTPPGILEICWPVIFGVLLAIIAPKIWNKVQELGGDVGLRLMFPYVLLSGRTELGISQELANSLPQLMIYLQFPIEGLITAWSLSRRVRFSMAMVQLAFLHGLGAFVLWILTKPGATHGL